MSQTLESRFKAGRKTIGDRMTENEKSYSSVFHKVMQEKDDSSHVDERKKGI